MSKKKTWFVSLVRGDNGYYIFVAGYKHKNACRCLRINAIQASAAVRKYIKNNLPSDLLEMDAPGRYDGDEIGKELKQYKDSLVRSRMEFDSKGSIRVEKQNY